MIKNKVLECLKIKYKSHLYLKSLSLKTDFSRNTKYFKLWHPRYFDVARRTQYEMEHRDFRNLKFNTQDPLHFDYHLEKINGGIPRLIDNLKNSTNENTFYSVYRIIFLMFHMAHVELYDKEFFDELDGRINFNLVSSDIITTRQIYGALYGYYKFNRGKAENILNFESLLESEPEQLHTEMTIKLFDLVHETKVVDPERLNILLRSFYKINFMDNWQNQIHFKTRNVAEIHRLFIKHNYLDEDVWKLLIKSTIESNRIYDINKFHQMLVGLNWINTNPKSPFFKLLYKEIETFKDRVRKNENKFWRYDTENIRLRTYDELLEKKEEFNEDYLYVHWAGDQKKQDVKFMEAKKTLNDAEAEALIRERLKAKDSFFKIKGDLIAEGLLETTIDNIFVNIIKEIQYKKVEVLRKDGKFRPDMTPEQIEEERKKLAQKAAEKPATAPAKKDDGKKKK